MNIIDQYITDHYDEPLDELAIELGISIGYVAKRKYKLQPPKPIVRSSHKEREWIDNEQLALLQLIIERKSGWAVEAAKQRLLKIQELANFSSSD